MARQCCRDSVAMKVIADDNAETEGYVTPCRWCCGYARYVNGRWHYAEDESVERRHATQADLLSNPYRQQRIADMLHQPLLPCHTCGQPLALAPADNVCPTCGHDFVEQPGSAKAEPQGTLADLEMEMDRHHGKNWKDI